MNWLTQGRRMAPRYASVVVLLLAACGGGGGGSGGGDGGGGGGGGGSVGTGGTTGDGGSVDVELTTPTGPPKAYVLDSLVLPAAAAASARSTVQSSAAVRPKPALLTLPQWNDAPPVPMPVPGVPMQIGAPRILTSTQTVGGMAQVLQWSPAPDGGQVGAISFTSVGAFGLRLGLVVEGLPDSARIHLYRQDRSQTGFETTGKAINEVLARNRAVDGNTQAAATWWSPDLGADEVTLEIGLPAGVPASQLRISIPRLTHAYVNLSLPTEADLQARYDTRNVGDAASCELDASCADQYATERNAVARMSYVDTDRFYYYCTGSLLNNTKLDYTPYFLSANHCISTQAAASSLRTDWFFRSASCNSVEPHPQAATRQRGARLLYATSVTDATLLLLNEAPPAGVTLAGWDARGPTAKGAAVYTLHQPQGDWLKYAEGQAQSYRNCTVSGGSVSCSDGNAQSNFLDVVWSKGITERGSSGSPLFVNGRVVGALSGGSSACSVKGGADIYSRFDKAFSDTIGNWLAQ
ncbi:MAG: trypsin-like peptidase domain-containing protein [Comamonas sp.]